LTHVVPQPVGQQIVSGGQVLGQIGQIPTPSAGNFGQRGSGTKIKSKQLQNNVNTISIVNDKYKGYEKFAKKPLYCIYGYILVQNKKSWKNLITLKIKLKYLINFTDKLIWMHSTGSML